MNLRPIYDDEITLPNWIGETSLTLAEIGAVVWENPVNGQRTYLRKFQENEKNFTMSGFVTDESGTLKSYFHDRRVSSSNKRRKGRLLLKR